MNVIGRTSGGNRLVEVTDAEWNVLLAEGKPLPVEGWTLEERHLLAEVAALCKIPLTRGRLKWWRIQDEEWTDNTLRFEQWVRRIAGGEQTITAVRHVGKLVKADLQQAAAEWLRRQVTRGPH